MCSFILVNRKVLEPLNICCKKALAEKLKLIYQIKKWLKGTKQEQNVNYKFEKIEKRTFLDRTEE